MKHQYFGDVTDYKKYGLLQILSNQGELTTSICWMLTPNDNRSDGRFITYLRDPVRWRPYNPAVFDLFVAVLEGGKERNVGIVQQSALLHSTTFFEEVLVDDLEYREGYLNRFWAFAEGANLVFFDPDNGFEVTSVPYGKRGSSKYLYWNEFIDAFQRGHSVLTYQHFPRKERRQFTETLATMIRERLAVPAVISFRTAHVVFLLAPQPAFLDYFQARSSEVTRIWGDEIIVSTHTQIGTESSISQLRLDLEDRL